MGGASKKFGKMKTVQLNADCSAMNECSNTMTTFTLKTHARVIEVRAASCTLSVKWWCVGGPTGLDPVADVALQGVAAAS